MVQSSNIISINTSTLLDTKYDTYLIDAGSGNLTLTLPNITANGFNYLLRRLDSTTNVVTVVGTSGQLINNRTSIELRPRSDLQIHSINNNWFSVISQSGLDSQISMHGPSTGYSFIFTNSATTYGAFYTRMIYRGSNYYGTDPLIFTVLCSSSNNNPQNYVVKLVNVSVTPNQDVAIVQSSVSGGTTNFTIASTRTFTNVPTTTSVFEVQAKLGTTSSTAPTNTVVYFHWIYIKFS